MGVNLEPFIGSHSPSSCGNPKKIFIEVVGLSNMDGATDVVSVVALAVVYNARQKKWESELKNWIESRA